MADGFLGRWSRRKLDAKDGKPLPELPAEPAAGSEVAPAKPLPPAPGLAPSAAELPVRAAASPAEGPVAPAPEPPPTLEDVRALTPDSDFSRFAARGVAPEVKNAAMKKLFADPHFNVMDGLDIYIDDYSKPDPMPESMLRSLVSAKFLGFFREEERKDEPGTGPSVPTEEFTPQTVAQSVPPPADTSAAATPADTSHADPDLRLQQDDAAPGQEPGRGTG